MADFRSFCHYAGIRAGDIKQDAVKETHLSCGFFKICISNCRNGGYAKASGVFFDLLQTLFVDIGCDYFCFVGGKLSEVGCFCAGSGAEVEDLRGGLWL